jgi:hypothetical protein
VSATQHTGPLPYRQQPCMSCPWRTDVPGTWFGEHDMAKLAAANGTRGAEADMHAPFMSCHLDQPDTAHPYRLCAGWLATVGHDHLGVRIALARGRLDGAPLRPGPHWPPTHPDLAHLLAARDAITGPDHG